MQEHLIDLSALLPQGRAEVKVSGNMVDLWTTHSMTPISFNLTGDSFKRHCAVLPGEYHLPFRVDMIARLDYSALIMLIGNGHITFASGVQDNRRIEDIVKPSGKPNQDHYSYNNSLPMGEFVAISVTYNLDEMQVLIGGEERFYSRKQSYMKAKNLAELNSEGFAISLAVSKLSRLTIQSITVTEFDERAPLQRGSFEVANPPSSTGEQPKPTFESIVANMPAELQSEILETDAFLRSLRPLSFKRVVDKRGGKITYVASAFGVSYALNASASASSHDFGWYIVYNGKPETWHRKADYMEEALAEVAIADPVLAERIFYALNDCVHCYGPRCLAKTLYQFGDEKRLSCHGRVMLRMCHSDFKDVRRFFEFLNVLLERKYADESARPSKILLT